MSQSVNSSLKRWFFFRLFLWQHKNNLRLQFRSSFKGALPGLRQFFAIESPLKVMRNIFYFTSKGLFVLKIFKYWS